MAVPVGSAHLSDEEFLAAFNDCSLPGSSFRHGDHLRLAWLLLHQYPFEEALHRVREGLRRFATHNNAPKLFHETITIAWVRLLATHHEHDFAEFLDTNGSRLHKDFLLEFWSSEVLQSAAAKAGWVAPDIRELPAI